jgi:Zn-dependent peptidase ImmA (M78 family)
MRTFSNSTEAAKYLLQQVWDGNLPVNVMDIASQIGIKLIPDASLDDEQLSGCINLQDNGTAICRYNNTESLVRQRFTVAHEIGHFILGHLSYGKQFRDNKKYDDQGAGSFFEKQANDLAAKLLMPDDVIEFLIRHEKITYVKQLADIFQVSAVAMQYRLNKLNWM